MTDRFDAITADLAAISRKMASMPTTRECWAFVLGFAVCGAFIAALGVGAVFIHG